MRNHHAATCHRVFPRTFVTFSCLAALSTAVALPVSGPLAGQADEEGTLIVSVETEPAGAGGRFAFSGVPTCPYIGADGETFMPGNEGTEGKEAVGVVRCVPGGGAVSLGGLSPGTYTTTELNPAPDFDVTEVRCDDGDSPRPSAGDGNSRTAVFNLDPGETVNCTFLNTRRATAVVAVETEPGRDGFQRRDPTGLPPLRQDPARRDGPGAGDRADPLRLTGRRGHRGPVRGSWPLPLG